jgi:hypothetical protein
MMMSMAEPHTFKANSIEAVPLFAPKSSPVAKAHAIILAIMGAPHKTKAGFDIVANKRARFPPPLAEVSG